MEDIKEKRKARRIAVFVMEGLDKSEAVELANKMAKRDDDPFDDRRVCFECSNHLKGKCLVSLDSFGRPQGALRFILQRCNKFKLKEKK